MGTFFCDRLKDHHSVLPGALTGILALAEMKNLPQGIGPRILQAMFLNVPCQSQVREDRDKIFRILKIFAMHQTEGKQ